MLAGGVPLAVPAGAAEHQAHGDASDRGVDAAVVHQAPDDQGERNVDVPAVDTPAEQEPEEGEAHERAAEGEEVDLAGEEHRDDQDGEEVVDDREGQQEGAQGRWQRGADDGEDGEREGDVGGGRDGPAVRGAVAHDVDEYVDHRGYDHAAQGGDHREGGRSGIAQVARDELALELDAGDEEEDGEESVGRPVLEREVQAEGGGADVEGPDAGVALRDGGDVRPQEGGDRGHEQQHAADGLGAQGIADEAELGQREAAEQLGALVVGGAGRGHEGTPPGGGWTA